MRVYYTPDHRLRNARTELHGGMLVKPFEAPFRAELIREAVLQQGHVEILDPGSFPPKMAASVHASDYLEFLETAWSRWVADGYRGEAIPSCFPVRRMVGNRPPRDIDGALGYYAFAAETAITQGTWPAALAAMSCALAAARDLRADGHPGFALCRPPGHHASRDQFGGYSFLNNAAIAAQYLVDSGLKRLAVLDVDFHHGNGTQDIYYGRGDVFFASIHGDPLDAFPHFLGFADEIGMGEGENCNANYPLPPGTSYDRWSEALSDALARIARFGAEALVVSLGVDTFERDPISFFLLGSEDFLRVGERIGRAGFPTLFCMEGGYGVPEIGVNTANVLTGFEAAAR
jgi:acetoin utilization deacetylase AcuC-like enzyme